MLASENPFCSHRWEKLAFRFRTGGPSSIAELLDRAPRFGAIVGPHGSGKTCLLEEIESFHRSLGREVSLIRINQQTSQIDRWKSVIAIATGRKEKYFLLDGAEVLRPAERFVFLLARLRRLSVICTAHTPGLFPEVYRCAPDCELFRELVHRIVDYNLVNPEMLSSIFTKSNADIRLSFRALYDAFASVEVGATAGSPSKVGVGRAVLAVS